MTTKEASELIKDEFMKRYSEWMADRFTLGDYEYGRKYGWQKSETLMTLKDSIKAIVFFQKYIFSGRTVEGWKRSGIENKAVWALCREGFLSVSEGNYRKPTFYYITQKTAKDIWKERGGKNGEND